jgi:hypothetical protein
MVRPLPELVVQRQVEEGDIGLPEHSPFQVSGMSVSRVIIIEHFGAAQKGVWRSF